MKFFNGGVGIISYDTHIVWEWKDALVVYHDHLVPLINLKQNGDVIGVPQVYLEKKLF